MNKSLNEKAALAFSCGASVISALGTFRLWNEPVVTSAEPDASLSTEQDFRFGASVTSNLQTLTTGIINTLNVPKMVIVAVDASGNQKQYTEAEYTAFDQAGYIYFTQYPNSKVYRLLELFVQHKEGYKEGYGVEASNITVNGFSNRITRSNEIKYEHPPASNSYPGFAWFRVNYKPKPEPKSKWIKVNLVINQRLFYKRKIHCNFSDDKTIGENLMASQEYISDVKELLQNMDVTCRVTLGEDNNSPDHAFKTHKPDIVPYSPKGTILGKDDYIDALMQKANDVLYLYLDG